MRVLANRRRLLFFFYLWVARRLFLLCGRFQGGPLIRILLFGSVHHTSYELYRIGKLGYQEKIDIKSMDFINPLST